MIRLSNISKQLLETETFGVIQFRYASGTITLYVTHPMKPELYGWNTKWTDPKKEDLKIRTIECTIPPKMIKGKGLQPYQIGKDTYLLPETIYDKITANWKEVGFK